jgi:hypothetical protein
MMHHIHGKGVWTIWVDILQEIPGAHVAGATPKRWKYVSVFFLVLAAGGYGAPRPYD